MRCSIVYQRVAATVEDEEILFLTQNLCAKKLMNTRNIPEVYRFEKRKEWSRRLKRSREKLLEKSKPPSEQLYEKSELCASRKA
jgi:hypothetical protein